jgi:uncharacterized membrane protein
VDARRSTFERLADWLTTSFGTVTFFLLNAAAFVLWIVFNTIDPFPYNFLTMSVSLEAIFLSIIVLISQNRAGKVSELREEIELYINTVAESEVTKLLHLMTLSLEKQGVDVSGDKELSRMLKSLNEDDIGAELEKQLQ